VVVGLGVGLLPGPVGPCTTVPETGLGLFLAIATMLTTAMEPDSRQMVKKSFIVFMAILRILGKF